MIPSPYVLFLKTKFFVKFFCRDNFLNFLNFFVVRAGVHLWREPPASLIGKISQFVIDNLSMTEGDAVKIIFNYCFT